MSEEYPLFVNVSDEAVTDAQDLIDSFKAQMKKVAEAAISDLYVDISDWIESDSWTNVRNVMLDALCNYGNRKIQGKYDFAKIRAKIFEDFHDDIINDLNQDLVEANAALKERIQAMLRYNNVR